jgi:glycosyltransferase involved in cell wall biosynthesis
MPAISVVIPLLNQAPFLQRALDSVWAQTVTDLEILLIDDGSTDAEAALAARYQDPRLRIIPQENRGAAAARNKGLAEARGDLVAFLNPDDAWKPQFLEVILRLRQAFPQAGAYATSYQIKLPEGREWRPPGTSPKAESPDLLIIDYYCRGLEFPISASAVAVSKPAMTEVGGFRAGPHLESRAKVCGLPVVGIVDEDVEAWLRLALRYPIAWSEECQAIYFKDDRKRYSQARLFLGEPLLSRTGRHALAIGLVPPDQVPLFKEYLAFFQLVAARHCLILGERDKALALLEFARGTKYRARWRRLRLLAALPVNPAAWLFLWEHYRHAPSRIAGASAGQKDHGPGHKPRSVRQPAAFTSFERGEQPWIV